MRGPVFLACEGAPRLRTAPPLRQTGLSFGRDPFPRWATEGCGHLSDGTGEREDAMTILLSLAIVFGTLCCLARPKPLRTVIPSQRLAELNRPRVR
jgi:hypothetical protein